MQSSNDEVTKLKTQYEDLQAEMDAWQYDGFRFDTIYQGTAGTEGSTYNFSFPTGKNLTSYKQLVFFVDAYYIDGGTNKWITKKSVMVEPKVNNVLYNLTCTYDWGGNDSTSYWSIFFSIINASQFRVDSKNFESSFNAVRIYKVIGLI